MFKQNIRTHEQLVSLSKEELIDIVLSLQKQIECVPQLEMQLNDLRNEVAEQFESQELCEENELNTFRRLSEQCSQQGINIESQQRAGASVDQVGSLSNVVARRDVAFIGSLSSQGQPQSSRNMQMQIGSMAPAIQSMSASLTSQAYSRQMSQQQPTQPLLLGSFSQTGAPQRSGFNPAPSVQQSGAPKPQVSQQRVNVMATKHVIQTVEEESDDVEVVM